MTNQIQNPKLKIAVLGSTRGTDMQAIIDAIKNGDLEASVEVVISNKPDAYILERAKNHGLDTIFIDSAGKTREQFDFEVMEMLDKKKIDLVLLIGYMRFISKSFVDKWRGKVMNVHPSLLPAFAGGMDKNVHQAVLDAGVKETGCTVHFVDEGADTGEIIVQKKCTVDPGETVETLKAKVQKLEGEALVEAVQKFHVT
ncbi:MAG: phosphoribosylglycinamide formyltransferase [Patescibacteria group bacterium]